MINNNIIQELKEYSILKQKFLLETNPILKDLSDEIFYAKRNSLKLLKSFLELKFTKDNPMTSKLFNKEISYFFDINIVPVDFKKDQIAYLKNYLNIFKKSIIKINNNLTEKEKINLILICISKDYLVSDLQVVNNSNKGSYLFTITKSSDNKLAIVNKSLESLSFNQIKIDFLLIINKFIEKEFSYIEKLMFK